MHGSDWLKGDPACLACKLDNGLYELYTPACLSGTRSQLSRLNKNKSPSIKKANVASFYGMKCSKCNKPAYVKIKEGKKTVYYCPECYEKR